MNSEELIDHIYEAAVITELWPSVLQDLSRIGDGALASLFVVSEAGLKWVGTPAADALIADYAALDRPDFNSRIPRRVRHPNSGFVHDLEYMSAWEVEHDPFYKDFLHPRGYGWVAATCTRAPSGEHISVNVERLRERGPYESSFIEKLDVFVPHLARSSLLAARLGLARAQAMTDVMQKVGLAAAAISATGRFVSMNAGFEDLIPSVVMDLPSGFRLASPKADGLLATALQSLRFPTGEVRSIPLPASPSLPPMIFHLLPVKGRAHDVFTQAAGIVIVTPVVPSRVPTAEVLYGLFDLTPAEARVARAIAGGRFLPDLALDLGVAEQTLRSQLKSVMAKTGLNRQAELAALLNGLVISQ